MSARSQCIWKHIEPWIVVGCHYVGVLFWTLLPPTLLSLIYPPMINGLLISPLAAVPIAIVVFDHRGYARWVSASHRSLSVRILRAVSDGVTWLYWW
jgi:hypothetical protein